MLNVQAVSHLNRSLINIGHLRKADTDTATATHTDIRSKHHLPRHYT